jgi:hypothetical protein
MPDDKVVNSDLEQLINEAETKHTNETPECDHANSDTHSRRWCRSCKKLICQFCWSVLDANYCSPCMMNVDLKVDNVIKSDDDGVEHHGRQLTPTQGFNTLRWIPNGKTTAKLLSEMSSDELSDYVDNYKQAVHDAERALDFRRIRLSAGQLELDERHDQQRRALRADKTKYPVRTVSIDPKTGKHAKSASTTANVERLLSMMKMLEALKAKKKS